MKNNQKILKYGKSSESLISLKQIFFKNNDDLLTKGDKVNELYSQQPKRFNCKNCDSLLENESFKNQYVTYSICTHCGHLNGVHEDTDSFCSTIYTENKGTDYAELYSSKGVVEYDQRVKSIYVPKAQFLFDSLTELGNDPTIFKYADIGAGTGYFLSALKSINLNKILGFEPSESQVSLGNRLLGENLLHQINLDDTVDKIREIDTDVVTMIGVLEHVQNPREILTAISANKKIKYLYISVPLFSFTVFFELVFPEVMKRHLTGGHTHLYTESSLKHMAKEFNLDIVASWWFGSDMIDLFRSVSVSLEKNKDTKQISSTWSELFSPVIDDLQLRIDEKHMSSEVHMILKVN
jgi:hypothetical protein